MTDLSLDSLLENLTAPEGEDLTKQASEAPTASVADELKDVLTKTASENTEENTNMSTLTGKDIAASVLAMLDGHDKTASNSVIEEHNKMVADDDARDELTPREGKTITETAKAIQARGAKGAVEDGGIATENEGNAGAPAADKAVPSDLDKKAAVDELMAEGIDFEEAVTLVKEASAQLEAEAADLEKAAAVSKLLAEGIDFDKAVTLVKEASAELTGAEVEVEYTDLEKSAAVTELMTEDGLAFDEAVALVQEAAGLGKSQE